MLSRGKIQESGDGEAAEAALHKMALLDTTAIPLDLLSSTERKAVQVLKQHALVTVDDKDLGAIHSLTQLTVRGQADKRDRRGHWLREEGQVERGRLVQVLGAVR